MTSSKMRRNVTHWKLFLKIDIIEPRARSTLAPIYDTAFLFDSFPPVEGKIAPKKIFYPYFLRNFCKFSKLFSPSYTFWLGPQMTPA